MRIFFRITWKTNCVRLFILKLCETISSIYVLGNNCERHLSQYWLKHYHFEEQTNNFPIKMMAS